LDLVCNTGLYYGEAQPNGNISYIYADYKIVNKKNNRNIDFSFISIFVWNNDSQVEYYIVDNWLSEWRPRD